MGSSQSPQFLGAAHSIEALPRIKLALFLPHWPEFGQMVIKTVHTIPFKYIEEERGLQRGSPASN